MAIRSFQRSIRFTNNEWDTVVEAAEKAGIAPGSVRSQGRRAGRGRQSLSLWRRLDAGTGRADRADLPRRAPARVPETGGTRRGSDRGALFDRAAEDARAAQVKALGTPPLRRRVVVPATPNRIPLQKGDSQAARSVILCAAEQVGGGDERSGSVGVCRSFCVCGVLGRNPKLERLDGLIDWSPVGRLAADMRRAQTGRPPYDPLSMLKALYLQALYDLSDPGAGGGPDGPAVVSALLAALRWMPRRRTRRTIWRFREQAGPLLKAAFEEIGRQIDKAGLMVRQGTLMDATLVASARRPPRRSARRRRRPSARARRRLDQAERQSLFRLQGACRRRPGARAWSGARS